MELKSLLFPNLIKMLIIKDGVLKIEKFNGSIKEIEISEIRKIYILKSNNNYNKINLITIIAVLLCFYFIDNFKTLLFLLSIFTSIYVAIIVTLKNRPKILYLKFKNKSTYSVKFNTKIKDLVLKMIWEIKNNNNL